MSKLKIESGIPMPRRSTVPDFPLSEMKVGDSFAVTISEIEKDRLVISQRLARFQKSNHPKRFSWRSESEKIIRVFRIADYT